MSKAILLSRKFYQRDPVTVAKELMGKHLFSNINGKLLSGKITEVEAYLSSDDPAAHSYKGKTKKNQSLYKNAGHAYVHRMHGWNLLDIVTESEDIPSSVLIRSLDNIKGPGKLCEYLQITYNLDGVDVTKKDSQIFVLDSGDRINFEILETPRIGINKGREKKLRFVAVI